MFSTRVNVHSTPVYAVYTQHMSHFIYFCELIFGMTATVKVFVLFLSENANEHRFWMFLCPFPASVSLRVYIFLQFEISNSELCVPGRAVFTVELYLQTERVLIVGAETQETQHDWIQALTKVTHFAYSTYAQNKTPL